MTIQTPNILIELIAKALQDPLIDWGAEKTIEILVWILLIAMAISVGVFSRRLEHAIIFALVTSIITIAFFAIP